MPSRIFSSLFVIAALLVPGLALAQETPTERVAARDVLKKMDALEQSLDVPGIVAKLTGPNAARDQVVARAKELMDTDLLAMADDIATHPEIGFQEKRSVKILTDYLKAHDFDVQMGVAGLDTAFVAKYKQNNGGPNLGIILEYDALRGTKGAFHGDQHSAQGPVGMAAGIAIAEWLTRTHTPGSVTMFGTPGEEMMPPNAKTVMHEAHVFDGMDVIVRSHSTSATSRAGARVRHVLPEHRRREVHVQRRAVAPDDAVGRTRRPARRDRALQQRGRGADEHPARGAHRRHHHRGRRGAQRRARQDRRPTSTSAIPTRSTSRR